LKKRDDNGHSGRLAAVSTAKSKENGKNSRILPTDKTKVIRDTFSFPLDDYALIKTLQDRLLSKSMAVSKSEILRMGLRLLARLKADEIADFSKQIQKLKPGRPRKKA
jgi:hypothetical protein